jgi:hypothetical protein
MAKKFIEGDYTPQQIEAMLTDHCDSKVEGSYYVDLTEEDLVEKHKELSQNLISLNEQEEELKKIKDEFKEVMQPMKLLQKELLTAIHVKKVLIKGTLYNIADQEAGVMETYMASGEFYESRRLKPEERQMRTALYINKAVGED